MGDVYAPRLRILIDPVYSQPANLSGSSTYFKNVALIEELTKRGHYVYWCIPDSNYTPHEVEDNPNVAIIRTSYIQDQFVTDGLFTDDFFNLFNRIAGKYHVDVICTSRNSLVLTYKRTLEPPRFHDVDRDFTDKGYGLPVVLLEEFVQTRTRQFTSESYWLNQALGYLVADKTVLMADHNREEIAEEMRDTFALSRIQEWTKKVRVIPQGIDTKMLDTVYDPNRWRQNSKFQVLSVGRLFGPSYRQFLNYFNYLYKSGMDDVCMTVSMSGSLSGPMRKALKDIGFDFGDMGRQFLLYENNPRSNFIPMLRGFNAFVAVCSHYDYPAGVSEAIYMGIPGIIPISDYQETFFPDYPFVVDPSKPEQVVSWLKWIKDNQEEARQMILPWRDIIRERYDATDGTLRLADEIEDAARTHINRFKTSAGVINLLKELKGKKYTFQDIVAYLKKSGKIGVSVGDMSMRTTFTYARSAIHHAMRIAGYVDECTGPYDVFVRRDIFDNLVKEIPNETATETVNHPDTCAGTRK